jgi:membrane-associated phospholipid phosphatase
VAHSRFEGLLPNGREDLVRQAAIWLGFVAVYQVARGLADRGSAEAFRNARRLIRLEQHLGGLPELELQRRALLGGAALVHAVNWTYWLAQFAVVAGGVVWIYLRRNDAYPRLRNTLIVTNTIGLVGYVLLPTAPPRLLPWRGFVDTLAQSEALNHGTGVVELLANPHAAMPSLHAADALIVGVALALTVHNRWLAAVFLVWPLWVCFALLATANHYWLDLAAGVLLAAFGALVTEALMRRRGRNARRPERLPRERRSRASGVARRAVADVGLSTSGRTVYVRNVSAKLHLRRLGERPACGVDAQRPLGQRLRAPLDGTEA